MNPGATTCPSIGACSLAVAEERSPTAQMTPSARPTSPANGAPPVPSMISPPPRIKSKSIRRASNVFRAAAPAMAGPLIAATPRLHSCLAPLAEGGNPACWAPRARPSCSRIRPRRTPADGKDQRSLAARTGASALSYGMPLVGGIVMRILYYGVPHAHPIAPPGHAASARRQPEPHLAGEVERGLLPQADRATEGRSCIGGMGINTIAAEKRAGSARRSCSEVGICRRLRLWLVQSSTQALDRILLPISSLREVNYAGLESWYLED